MPTTTEENPSAVPDTGIAWIDLSQAFVRLTSEDPDWPIESALNQGDDKGWKAAQPGPQSMWIDFQAPQAIRKIQVRFETTDQRTQEFALMWSGDGGGSYREIVRQQFNFSREGSSVEEENYSVHLTGVTNLKLTITPNISGGDIRATLHRLRVA